MERVEFVIVCILLLCASVILFAALFIHKPMQYLEVIVHLIIFALLLVAVRIEYKKLKNE